MRYIRFALITFVLCLSLFTFTFAYDVPTYDRNDFEAYYTDLLQSCVPVDYIPEICQFISNTEGLDYNFDALHLIYIESENDEQESFFYNPSNGESLNPTTMFMGIRSVDSSLFDYLYSNGLPNYVQNNKLPVSSLIEAQSVVENWRNNRYSSSSDDPSPGSGSGLDPVVSGSLSDVLGAISQMLASAVSWVGTVSNTVSTTPIFLFAFVLAFVPIGVNLFRRLL